MWDINLSVDCFKSKLLKKSPFYNLQPMTSFFKTIIYQKIECEFVIKKSQFIVSKEKTPQYASGEFPVRKVVLNISFRIFLS